MRGWPLTGSGKSGTPFLRMHWANVRAVDICAGVIFALKEPGGCSSLHALTALFHFGALTLIPKEGKSPAAVGPGKALTPFAPMHSRNFHALSRPVMLVSP